MPRYAFVSIAHGHSPADFKTFQHLYGAVGQNTGNLLFTNAVWRQIAGDKERIGFTFDPERVNERFDAVIIPAANWVNPGVDFAHIADLLEKLTIPIVVIGLGAQSPDHQLAIDLPEGTLRFLKAVFDRAESVSVRGAFTHDVLKKLGFHNVRVTGCPSLYCDFRSFEPPKTREFELDRCLLNATRFSAGHAPFARDRSVNRSIFRFAYERGLDILYQSEKEELALLFGFPEPELFDDRTKSLMTQIYAAESWDAVAAYVQKHGRAFLDVNAWSDAMTDYRFVCGTRLHGTIMALNSGVPAMLLWHDSRTREMAEFAKIPSMDATRLDISEGGLRAAYEGLDLDHYYRRRREAHSVYNSFLEANRLEYNSESHINTPDETAAG